MINQLLKNTRLHEGEAEALAIAKHEHALVLADDKEARTVAKALNVPCLGSVGILLAARFDGHLSMSEFENAITDLTNISWQSPDVIALALKRAREERP